MERMETYIKLKSRWIFVGWGEIDRKFKIKEKENKKFIYITNKHLDGTIEEVKYRKLEREV